MVTSQRMHVSTQIASMVRHIIQEELFSLLSPQQDGNPDMSTMNYPAHGGFAETVQPSSDRYSVNVSSSLSLADLCQVLWT
jgi:hypothetical protein